MIVRNKRNGKELRCLTAFSILPQIRGLMFRAKPVPILFDFGEEAIHPIHSLFVFFPFDAIYISEGKKVLEKARIQPFSPLHKNSIPARYLLEADASSGASFSPGDEVELC
ncbi:MAG: DUF192 domain-containing protein [Candidatus ainarchaeum sp.]|nr:DUF192 domain-containing protein [Candidatus ainarchaeum sp.]